ncbi:hypothetical protein DPMN_030904 [Dreissena polymorpha]|uniref:DUF7802 domain-containing protein n=1 Tax=Dreissena polymorpha TaxID=45954 RepID=A0A9D4M1L6_DREPO|nr:hypothetical protein DPMN_030904 [Dreissena polymorpha]
MDEIMTEVIIHYTYFLYLVFTSKPENIEATGVHEPVGPCNVTQPVQTPFGAVRTLDLSLALRKLGSMHVCKVLTQIIVCCSNLVKIYVCKVLSQISLFSSISDDTFCLNWTCCQK